MFSNSSTFDLQSKIPPSFRHYAWNEWSSLDQRWAKLKFRSGPNQSTEIILWQMAADKELARIPVAILTTSTSERSVCDILPPGRCLYFVKTDNIDYLQTIIKKIIAHAMEVAVR